MPTSIDNALPRATPESQGIPSSAILRFIEAAETHVNELHSFMLLRHGSVIAEGWLSPYRPPLPHAVFSLSKSFTSTAVGLAVSEGRFSLDDTVLSFFADEAPAQINEHLSAMRVRHLLSMSTGHADDTWGHMTARPDGDWMKGFFEVPVHHPPGTHFLYNTGATYMLSAIVQRTTGMKLIDYLQSRLFEPLGIENAAWDESPQGVNMGGIGLKITTEDIARFGQFCLQKGFWAGRQILPESWVEEATALHMDNGEDADSDWAQGYGYQFWRCRHGAYRGDGVFGQYCVVMPEQDAVLAITGGVDLFDMQQPLDLVWEYLLPAMGADPFPEDAESHGRLTEKVANLTLPPVPGDASSPLVAQVSGRLYHIEADDFGVQTIAFHFTETGCTLMLQTAAGGETIPCGCGAWRDGQSSLFHEPWVDNPARITASAAWTAGDTFTIVARLVETPFYETMICTFADDQLLVEVRANIGFDVPPTHLWVGQSHEQHK